MSYGEFKQGADKYQLEGEVYCFDGQIVCEEFIRFMYNQYKKDFYKKDNRIITKKTFLKHWRHEKNNN